MCGICGFAGFTDPRLLSGMTQSISHRGPDSEGTFSDTDISLGIRRLSIIDLVTGDQPITNEDGSIVVVFNGEIYNFQDLRVRLMERGHTFSTKSDTEVIVHLYEDMGEDFPCELKGMFAIALWDRKQRKLLIVRDQVGIKPLYYHVTPGGNLVFASEVKAILLWEGYRSNPDLQGLHYLLNLRYVPGERTLFRGIKRLLPGNLLTWRSGDLRIRSYHSFDFEPDREKTEDEWLELIDGTLKGAVNRHLVSDVPLGVYLSGGLDSSAIVSYLNEAKCNDIRTFTLGFNQESDENEDAAFVSRFFGLRHKDTYASNDPLQSLPEIIYYMEEPKVNQLQGYLLSMFARQHVKVVISGLGGDELFGGYITNRFLRLGEIIGPLMKGPVDLCGDLFGKVIASLDNRVGDLRLNEYRRGIEMLLKSGRPEEFYLILRNAWDLNPQGFRNIYSDGLDTSALMNTSEYFRPFFRNKTLSFLEACLMAEFSTKLVDDFLANEDRTSMANSLESRVPFLDRDLVELCLKMPGRFKVNHFTLKYLFKKLLRQKLPRETLEKKKWGFAFNPYEQYLKDLRMIALKVLTRKRVSEMGLFNYDYIDKILNTRPSPRLRWHYFYLWLLIGFDIWHKIFVEKSRHFKDPLDAFFNKT